VSSKKYRTYFNLSRILIAFILAVGMVFLAGGGEPSLAASGIWQGAFSNIWNLDANWMPGGYPNAAGEIAFFDGWGAPTHVTISSVQVTVGNLVIINNTAYLISAENGGSLAFKSASSSPATVFTAGRAEHVISVPITLSSDLSITNYASEILKILGDINQASGAGSLYVDIAAGRQVAFYGANSYSGGTNILGGTLLLGGNTSAGSGPVSLLCSTDPCNSPDVPASLGNLSGDTLLQNPLLINHNYVEFLGPGSMSFTSLESSLTSSAEELLRGY
jgi:hypothetical protein